jgi:ubiquinol-cytochrome c reductase cytochrome b subunit
MKRALDWLDDRTGYRALMSAALDEPVLGGASMVYVFGSVLTFLLLLQLGTGVLLAMYYSPSASDAWASVAFIEDQVSWGWFVRGLHHHGASAMVIVAGLHMLQTALYGAYKRPRELNWIVGVLLLGLILAFALTGYLLPWDQTGYWATKVATGLAGSTPVVGAPLQEFLQAGNEYGNLTITRFFAIHVFVLPAALLGLVFVHLFLFRRHGVTPHWSLSEALLRQRVQPFWPDQLFRDLLAMTVAFAALAAANLASHGAGLDAPADPASNFDARPEWYFRPLFQLLKYFHGPLETVVALGTPVVVGAVLLGLPFVDRDAERSPRRRWKYLTVLGAGGGAALLVTVLSYLEDRADAGLAGRLAESERLALEARRLAVANGVPHAGGAAVYTTAPHHRARVLWAEHCAGCHAGAERKGPEIGPGYNSRAWIREFLADPSGDRFFGRTEKIDKMKPVTLRGADLDAIVELVYAQSGAADADPRLVARGQTLFDEGDCSNCHSIDWETEGELGPNLGRRGSVEMLTEFIARPGHPRWFGDLDEMPDYGDKLGPAERRALAEYLVSLRDAPGASR